MLSRRFSWTPTLTGLLVAGSFFLLAPAAVEPPGGSDGAAAALTASGSPAAQPTTAPTPPPVPTPTPGSTPGSTPATGSPPPAHARPAKTTAPAVPADSGTGRRVVYSIEQQRVWLVAGSGTVESTYLVSGRLSQPGPGSYRVYSRSRHARSAVSDATMQYMVRFAHGARTGAPIGFHDIPRRFDGGYEQSVADLGKPLSAGCIRQSSGDARRLWAFAPVGTRVVVVR